MELWKLLVAVLVPVIVLVILLASLIPRPVPCDEHPPKIELALSLYKNPQNQSEIYEAPLICFSSARDPQVVDVRLVGDFLITGPKDGSPKGEDPRFYWNDARVSPASTSACKDLKIYMRPGVFACSNASFVGPWVNQTEAVSFVKISAEVRDPCNVKRKSVSVPSVSGDALNLTVTSVDPGLVCLNTGNLTVTVTGNGFLFYLPNPTSLNATWVTPTVFYQDAALDNVSPVLESCENKTISGASGASLATPMHIFLCTNMTVTLPNRDSLLPGPDNLTVVNAGPCGAHSSDSLINAVRYSSGTVRVFAAAPDVLYNGVSFQITIYTSGLSSSNSVRRVVFIDSTTTDEVLALIPDSSPGGGFNEIKVTIPAYAGNTGLPAGTYDLVIEAMEDPVGCSGRLVNGIVVVDQATLDITSVEPRFIWSGSPASAITVYAANGLLDSPSMYVSLPSISAAPVSAVSYVDASTVNGIVRNKGNLALGTYDIIVINPDNSVGVLREGLHIVSNPPPSISVVKPDSVPGAPVPATISGSNFHNASVRLDCISLMGIRRSYNVSGATSTSTQVNVTWPFSGGLAVGDFCVVVVINGDGVEAKYSGISYKPTSLNLQDFKPGSTMHTARRGNAVALARPTEATRFLYAIGGDSNANNGYVANVSAFDTVESVPVDRLGTMGTWSLQRNKLPFPCTYSDARVVSMFVYLLCGSNGTAPTNKILRAQVLDPLQTPELDLDIDVDENATGIERGIFATGGQFVYRISAVFGPSDPSNPNGESLPSEPLTLKLPAIRGESGAFILKIMWDAIPGATGYKIYRTVNESSAKVIGLLTDVDTGACNGNVCEFVDRGTGNSPDSTIVPNVLGSLGQWHEVESLTTARAWGAFADSPQPGTTRSNTHYLYAFGGISNGSTPVNTFEYTTITITYANGKIREEQSVSSWTVGATTMQRARYNLMATTMDPSIAPNLASLSPGSFYIHVGPGNTDGGLQVQDIEVSEVSANGTLVLNPTASPAPGARNGACMFPYTTDVGELGFIGGRPSAQGTAGKLVGSAGCSGVNCLTSYGPSWNAGWGISPQNPSNVRCIKVKPFVYLAGGVVSGAPTTFTAFNYV